jgi:hypothetical protein
MQNQINTIIMPVNSKGIKIVVNSGGFVMNQAGYTAFLLIQPTLPTGPGPTVSLQLAFDEDPSGLTAYYVTQGGEFTYSGFQAAQLKVTNSANVLVYSIPFQQSFDLQAVLG